MRIRHAVGLSVAFNLVWSFGAAAAPARAPVPVRVYDDVGLRKAVLEQVLSGAADVFRPGGVTVSWTACARRGATDKGCNVPLAPGELSVRVVTVPLPRGYRGDAPLGDALIDEQGRAGVLATVYYTRVEWTARSAGTSLSTLLARTLAHEIEHLLAGTTHHDEIGLMRPLWTIEELRRDRAWDWRLDRN